MDWKVILVLAVFATNWNLMFSTPVQPKPPNAGSTKKLAPSPQLKPSASQVTTSTLQRNPGAAGSSSTPAGLSQGASSPLTQQRVSVPSTTQQRVSVPSTTQQRVSVPSTTQQRVSVPSTTQQRVTVPSTTQQGVSVPPTNGGSTTGQSTNRMAVPSSSNTQEVNRPVPQVVDTNDAAEGELLNQRNVEVGKICKYVDHRKCKIYFNEILPPKRLQSGYSEDQFLELRRTCGKTADLKGKESLNGYVVLIVDLARGDAVPQNYNGTLVFFADLRDKDLTKKQDESNDEETQFYFTIGTLPTSNIDLSKTDIKVQNLIGLNTIFGNGIPSETNYPKAVLLLYLPVKQRTQKNYQTFYVKSHPSFQSFHPKRVHADLVDLINKYTVDMVVYGRECSVADAKILRKFYNKFPAQCEDFITSFEGKDLTSTQRLSYSKCGDVDPFQISTFRSAGNTHGYRNNCRKQPTEYPFNLRMQRLKSQSQKIILNLWYSIKKAKSHTDILNGFPLEVAAELAGVSDNQLRQASFRHRNNIITTPGKKRKASPCSVLKVLDNFDLDKIRSLIQEGYAEGSSLTASDLRHRFLEYKDGQIDALRILKEQNPAISLPPRFRCTLFTFRKVLRAMGFRYRKIDLRAKIIQRADLVGWRGKYLKTLRKNNATETPKKLVYLDETWVDPFVRTAKGWIPAVPYLKKDMALYTYGTMKVGKGPRLIVLSAVAPDGVIKETISVEKVSKAQSELADYHKNVNADRFVEWFKILLDALEKKKRETNQDFIIIMDNASYHSTRLYPKKSDTKRTMYDWLKQYEGNAGLDLTLPPYSKVRKWELQVLIDDVVINPVMEGELHNIDHMAKLKGFDVVRLPPYHCHFSPIELVWKDVKHNTRKRNTRQNLDMVKGIVEEELLNYNAEILKKHYGHVERLEREAWIADGLLDEIMEKNQFVVDVGDDSDDSEEPLTPETSESSASPSNDDELLDIDDDDEYLDWAADVLEVQLLDGDELIESDGTLWIREECDEENDEYDIETEVGRHMYRDVKRYRSDPLLVARIINSESTSG